MRWTIYKITNVLDGKSYVGQTKRDVLVRFESHCKSNTLIGRAIKKYGRENFSLAPIAFCFSPESAYFVEIALILKNKTMHPDGYNLILEWYASGFGVGNKGKIRSAESRLKYSEARKKYIGSMTPEQRAKLSTTKGKPAWNKGQRGVIKRGPHSAETRAKISAANKGLKRTSEQLVRISEGHKGHKPSIETRLKLSAAMKGRIVSAETCAKRSAAMKIIAAKWIMTPELRAKRSEYAKRGWSIRRAMKAIEPEGTA